MRALFDAPWEPGSLAVIDIEGLIRMKRTQRAKDYPVIGELARRLPEDREILYTTDPDRILALAPALGAGVPRLPVREALRGGTREDVAVALAREANALQEEDRRRLERLESASRTYLQALIRSGILDRPLDEAHRGILDLAGRLLLPNVPQIDRTRMHL